MVCHGVMALNEGIKFEAMRGLQMPAIYHNGGGVNLNYLRRLGREGRVGQSQLQRG